MTKRITILIALIALPLFGGAKFRVTGFIRDGTNKPAHATMTNVIWELEMIDEAGNTATNWSGLMAFPSSQTVITNVTTTNNPVTSLNTKSKTFTNFVNGRFYTNNIGKGITIQATVWRSHVASAGRTGIAIQGGNGATMANVVSWGAQTLTTTPVVGRTNSLFYYVTNTGVYCFTNTVSGGANAAGIVAGTGCIVTD